MIKLVDQQTNGLAEDVAVCEYSKKALATRKDTDIIR